MYTTVIPDTPIKLAQDMTVSLRPESCSPIFLEAVPRLHGFFVLPRALSVCLEIQV